MEVDGDTLHLGIGSLLGEGVAGIGKWAREIAKLAPPHLQTNLDALAKVTIVEVPSPPVAPILSTPNKQIMPGATESNAFPIQIPQINVTTGR